MKLHRACALNALILAGAAQPVVAQIIGQNFTGSTRAQAGGAVPAHPNGAIGTDYFVEFVKNRWATYRKSDGALVASASGTAHQFWSAAGVTVPATDTISYPRMIYDHASRRWFASSIDVVGGLTRNTNNIMVAVSNSSDPTAGWKGFSIDPHNQFADLVTLGLDADGVYLASNNWEASRTQPFLDISIISIPKSDLLLPTPTVANRTVFPSLSAAQFGFTLQPSVNMGPSTGRGAILGADFEVYGVLDRTDLLGAQGPLPATLSHTNYLIVPDDEFPPLARQPDGTRDLETGR